VVIVAGGLKYTVPAWVALSSLRRAGCALPAELWFPAAELPDAAFAAALRNLGAAVRNADDVYPGGSAAAFKAGFALKAVAILFSRFEEVLFVDADNVALRDPTDLFDWPPYRSTGMLLWPDFWPRSAAPDAFAIAPEAMSAYDGVAANRSVESGQLLLHKRVAWRAATMAWFVNIQGPLYYRLLCSYMGAGDKETWAFAAALAGGPPPARVATPAGSAGVPGVKHPEHLLSNTMVRRQVACFLLRF
jgi:alpha 1,2-mannosyltransferase